MRYVSTRGGTAPLEFQDAVLAGLAEDGGLLVPESGTAVPAVCSTGVPPVSSVSHMGEMPMPHLRDLPYDELALEVMTPFVGDLPRERLAAMLKESYSLANFSPSPAPLVRVGDIHVLELWHGPTLAFKDIALQFLGRLFEHILAERGGHLNVLGATSGDTGSAAIAGLRGRRGINIFMMHPHGKISPIQARQMTTVLDANVHNIAVDGSFDDCQRILKELFCDTAFKAELSLGAVNSVNWARVLAQIVYYFRLSLELCGAGGAPAVQVAVPTGNFGDILAGWYAMRMGAPIRRLILATNENDILARFFTTGTYSRGVLHQTLAPAMDIQVASNFERYLYYRLGCDGAKLHALMEQVARTGAVTLPLQGGQVDPAFLAASANAQQVLDTIREFHRKHGYMLDPHTAVGVSSARRALAACDCPDKDLPLVCLATAHGAKFPDAIRQATGEPGPTHPAIEAILTLPTRCERLPNDATAVKDFIRRLASRQS